MSTSEVTKQREATIEELARLYRNYGVTDTVEGLKIENRYELNYPQGITFLLDTRFWVDANGMLRDQLEMMRDHHNLLEKALKVDLGGVQTDVLFGCFERDHNEKQDYFRVMDPKDAAHVLVRVIWNRMLEKDLNPFELHMEQVEYAYAYESWTHYSGCIYRVIKLEREDAAMREFIEAFQQRVAGVREWTESELELFSVMSVDARKECMELAPRIEALGWKVDFGDEGAEEMTLTQYSDNRVSSSVLRYIQALPKHLRNIVELGERQMAERQCREV